MFVYFLLRQPRHQSELVPRDPGTKDEDGPTVLGSRGCFHFNFCFHVVLLFSRLICFPFSSVKFSSYFSVNFFVLWCWFSLAARTSVGANAA